MKAKPAVVVFLSMLVGLAITCVSELFSTHSIDVVYRGIPLPWIIQVIPRAGLILWKNFIADAVFWILITSAISILLMYLLTRGQRQINLSNR